MTEIIFRVFWSVIRSPAVVICVVLVGIAIAYFCVEMFGATGGVLVVPVAGP